MVNKALFKTSSLPNANIVNNAGGAAYSLNDKHALAQAVSTGTLGSTFYMRAESQLDNVLNLCRKLPYDYVAKCAVYGASLSMKDLPALLLAYLHAEGKTNAEAQNMFVLAFPRVITNGKNLRNFVQIVRSGKLGSKSFGSVGKKLVQNYLSNRTDDELYRDSVGNTPSIADIIRMVHPKPNTQTRDALFKHLLDRDVDFNNLPELVRNTVAFKNGDRAEVPNMPVESLFSDKLTDAQWKQLALRCSPKALRMNLNTFQRHKVLDDRKTVKELATKMSDPNFLARSKDLPYQYFQAYLSTKGNIPNELSLALQDALELSAKNVPVIKGQLAICVDVSGSMSSPVTGDRGSATTNTTCSQVASLIASSLTKVNPSAQFIAFETQVLKNFTFNPKDSIVTNAEKFSKLGGGGTDIASGLEAVNPGTDVIIIVSDNESWFNSQGVNRPTRSVEAWKKIQKSNPNAKLILIDLTPNTTTQVPESNNVLNIGGWSDAVFKLIDDFASGRMDKGHWVSEIENIKLD